MIQHVKQTVHFLQGVLWPDFLADELYQFLRGEVDSYRHMQRGCQCQLGKHHVTADPEAKICNCHKRPNSTKTCIVHKPQQYYLILLLYHTILGLILYVPV